MTSTPQKKCPKCGGEMENDKQLGSYTEITFKREDQFLGDGVQAFYCINCGYVIEGQEAPKECPACKHPQAFYEVLADNY